LCAEHTMKYYHIIQSLDLFSEKAEPQKGKFRLFLVEEADMSLYMQGLLAKVC
jgi:hypothetical protein